MNASFKLLKQNNKNLERQPKMENLDPLLAAPGAGRICIECGKEFERPARSRSLTCSDACHIKRKRQIAENYRHDVCDLRAKLLDRFGGKWPTEEEIFQLLQQRNGTRH